MDTQPRQRPSLQPLWTNYQNLGGHPRTVFRGVASPMSSVSPGLPSPMHPMSADYDPSMRQRERSLVDSLDSRSGIRSGVLTPIAEQATRLRHFTMASPTPQSAGSMRTEAGVMWHPKEQQDQQQQPRRMTVVDETRSILLAGVPRTHRGSIVTSVERRPSLPVATPTLGPSLPATTPTSATPACPTPRRHSAQVREQLQAWGHVYLGNHASAGCFVAAVPLRRTSESSSASSAEDDAAMDVDKDKGSDGDDDNHDDNKKHKEKTSRPPSVRPNKVTIRARVRPRALERKPFLLQRTFDLDQLRSTVQEPETPLRSSPSASSPHSSKIKPLPPTPIRKSPIEAPRRTALPASATRRRPSASAGHGPELTKALIKGANAIPIHLPYARQHLPVLAALMLSGHIRPGDIVDLPLPRPEAWYQTVAYVYTGQGKLTSAVEENIVYLAGRV